MLTKFLALLFRTDNEYQYVAHPRQTIYAILIMVMGWATMTRDNWFTFGIITFILGCLLFITIILAINWEKVTRYWETLDEFANTMIKANNPDLWYAMGFKNVPKNVTITETKQADNESGFSMKFKQLPVSPATMQLIADNVLLSGDADFTETKYGHIPGFRNIQKEFKKKGMLAQKNQANVRNGHRFNKKGYEVLYNYASESVKLELRKKETK